jgi:hypothetical protein
MILDVTLPADRADEANTRDAWHAAGLVAARLESAATARLQTGDRHCVGEGGFST